MVYHSIMRSVVISLRLLCLTIEGLLRLVALVLEKIANCLSKLERSTY